MAGYLGLWLTGGGGGDATTSGKAASVCGAAIAGAAALAASRRDPGLAGSPPATSGDGAGRLGLFFLPVLPTGAARASTTWAVSQLLSRYVLRGGRDVGQVFRAAREACKSASATCNL